MIIFSGILFHVSFDVVHEPVFEYIIAVETNVTIGLKRLEELVAFSLVA
jgi:hypothetical protein